MNPFPAVHSAAVSKDSHATVVSYLAKITTLFLHCMHAWIQLLLYPKFVSTVENLVLSPLQLVSSEQEILKG